MNFNPLEGLIAAPFSPFKANGTLNLELIPSYYQLLKSNNVTGAFICGSTGEGVSLTKDEKMQLAEAWAAATNHDDAFKVMTLLGGTCIEDCKVLARHAASIGLYAVSFTAPSYFKPANAAVLAEICAEIASEIPAMPFYYYHIPVLTGANIAMIDLLAEVNNIQNFAGIKYTHEDFMDFLSCMKYDNGRYDMLWGRDENMLSALVLGVKASVGSTFNYIAPVYHQLIDAFEQRDFGAAANFQQISINFIRLLGKFGGIATGKAYMKLIDMDCGSFRLPVKNMSAEQFIHFSELVQALGFEKYQSKIYAADAAPQQVKLL